MEKKFNKKLWIPIIAGGVALLAAIGIVIGVLVGNSDSDESTAASPDKLFWNLDRAKYIGKNADGSTWRDVDEDDNYYHISYAMEEGRYTERRIKDKKLVEELDQYDVIGLVSDEKNIVVGYRDISEFTGGIAINRLYYVSREGNKYKFNAAATLDGLEFTYEIPGNAKFYDVSTKTDREYGSFITPDDLVEGDIIVAIKDKQGKITHVYLAGREVIPDIYWNVERKWDSTNKVSTRKPNEVGEFEFLMALNGEQLTVKTTEQSVATGIDGYNGRCMGLVFDENGYVIKTKNTRACTGGPSFASWYVVTDIDEGRVTAYQSSSGTSVTAPMSPKCKVFNVSGVHEDFNGFDGEYGELRVGDKLHGLLNDKGQICIIFIVGNRKADTEVYWNKTRMYDSQKAVTTRVPDASGRYVFDVYVNGTHRTLWTKSKEVATKIDSQGAQAFGAVLNGDEIIKFYTPAQSTGGSAYASWDVQSVSGSKIALLKDPYGTTADAGKTKDLEFASDCKIFDMSANANPYGQRTTKVSVNDRINILLDKDGKIAYLFITKHVYNSDVFFNVTRMWNSTKKESTRTLDPDGTYHIKLLVNGTVKVYRTADKSLIDELDAYSVRAFGLETKGDIITRSFPVASVSKTRGGTSGAMYIVQSIKGNVIHLKDASGKTADITMGSGCKVYNAGMVDSYIGEPTNVKVGDKLLSLLGADKKAVIIYVVDRAHTHICEDCGKNISFTTLTGGITKPGNYHVCLGSDLELAGQISIGGTSEAQENVHVTLCLNGHTIKPLDGKRAIAVIGKNCSLDIVDCKGTGKIAASGNIVEGMKSSVGAAVWVRNGRLKIYKAIIDASAVTNPLNGVDDSGKNVNYTNSAVYVASGAEFTMLGGEIIGTKQAIYGGSMYIGGEATLKNVTVKNGVSSTAGGNIYLSKAGKINLMGTVNVVGGKLSNGVDNNLFMPASPQKLNVQSGLKGNIGITVTDMGVFTNGGVASSANAFRSDVAGGVIKPDSDGALTFGYELSAVSFTKGDVTIGVADSLYLPTVITPASVKDKVKLTFESSDPDSVYVDKFGMIVGVKETGSNTVNITVTAKSTTNPENKKTAVCKVSVVAGTPGLHSHKLNGKGSDVKFTEWTDTSSLPTESGYYYLANDVELTSAWSPAENQSVYICLNGKKVTAASNKQAIRLTKNAFFAICDCSEGEIGLIIANGDVSAQGGVIYMSNGEGALYGGTVTGGKVIGDNIDGGNISILKDATFNMFGGTVKNGVAQRNGGNIYAQGKLNILGGAVIGGSSTFKNPRGLDIMVSGTAASLKLADNAYIGDVFLNNSMLSAKDYKGYENESGTISKISITLTSGKGVFSSDKVSDDAYKFFKATAKGCAVIVNEDGYLEIADDIHKHCVCGGNCESVKENGTAADKHTCDKTTEFKTVSTYDELKTAFTNGGSYYLVNDIDMKNTGAFNLAEGKTVNLCLNGFNIYTAGKIRAFNLSAKNSVLNLSDCSKEKSGVIGPNDVEKSVSQLVYLKENAEFNMFGGTIANGVSPAASGGNVGLAGTSIFRLFGGSVINGVGGDASHTTIDGGNIYVPAKTSFFMYGGVVSGGKARNGANIWVAGNIDIAGGEIKDGIMTGNGANIFMSASGVLKMSGGEINGGKKNNDGTVSSANVMLYGDGVCVYMSGGSIDGRVNASKFDKFYITGKAVIADETGKYGISIASDKVDDKAIRIAKKDGSYAKLDDSAEICLIPTAANDNKIVVKAAQISDAGRIKLGTGVSGSLTPTSSGLVYKKSN